MGVAEGKTGNGGTSWPWGGHKHWQTTISAVICVISSLHFPLDGHSGCVDAQ